MKIQPFKGVTYALEGFKLIRQPELRVFVIAPIIVSLLIYCIVGYFSISYFGPVTNYLMGFLPDWEWLIWLIQSVLFISLLLIAALTFTLITNLLAAPFLSLLAEKTECFVTGQPISTEDGWIAILKSIHTSLGREIRKLLYYLPRLLLVFILTFIPAVNAFSPLLWFLFGAWMMSVQYLDYPIDANQLKFTALKQHLDNHRAPTLAFGAVITIMLTIPLFSIIVIPAAVAGATAFWVKEEKLKAQMT